MPADFRRRFARSFAELPQKPDFSQPPIAQDCFRRNVEHLGRFLDGQASKETHLYNAAFPGIDAGESAQRVIQGDDVRPPIAKHRYSFIERHLTPFASALVIATGPGAIHQYATHQLSRNGKEMGAILPAHIFQIDKPLIRFVDQGRGLQRVCAALPHHMSVREPVQLVINERDQPVQRFLLPLVPRLQQLRNVLG